MEFILGLSLSVVLSIGFLGFDWTWGHQLVGTFLRSRRIKISVVTDNGEPFSHSQVIVSGAGVHNTGPDGAVKIYIPRDDIYGFQFHSVNIEEGVYMVRLRPGESYEYVAGSSRLELI